LKTNEAKSIVHQYFQCLLNERDLAACDRWLAPDYVDHDSPPGTPPGPIAIKTFVAKFLDEYPDLHVVIEDIFGEGLSVAARLLWNGNHRTSGEEYHVRGIVLIRLNDAGQLAERWSAYTNIQST
jgi:predicted SnoaL-like aldol condensation-catalyzing enzyme